MTRSTTASTSPAAVPPVSASLSPARRGSRRLLAATLTTIAVSSLVIGGLFAVLFVSIFGSPEPRGLPVAVVGVDASTVQTTAGDRYAILGTDSIDTAMDQLRHREVYAVIQVDSTQGRIALSYASAEGASVLAYTQPIAQSIADASHLPLHLTNITPDVPASAAPGRSLFFAAFGAALVGFMFAQALASVSRTFGLTSLRIRLGMMVGVSALAGLIVALILGPWYGVIPQPVAQTWPILSLLCLSIVAGSAALIDLLGEMGTFAATFLFTVLGNATSTGILPYEFLSKPLQVISNILPTGNVVRGLLGQAFFSGTSVGAAYLVPALWAAGSILVITAIAGIRQHRRPRAETSSL